ncbi:MAG: hypothetical protein ACKOC4_00370 [Planctomycetia bacterium]
MSAPPVAAAHWSLDGLLATTPGGGRLDLDAPGRGLVLDAGRDRILGVDLRSACGPSEHWLRGPDLIAVYEPADPRRLRATAMWRLLPATVAPPDVAWELTLSAQTSLVQSDAVLSVVSDVGCLDLRSRVAAGRWTNVPPDGQPTEDATCLLVRRPAAAADPPATLLVAVHPADARRIAVRRQDGRVEVACWLFSTAIEKGVLMRGRVLAAIGPTHCDEAWAERAIEAFACSPPPLTA